MTTAACACGALTATLGGDPLGVAVCHCDACRVRSGSAFSWNARYRAEDVAIEGAVQTFARTGDDGGTITQSFCPTCGVTVCYTNSGRAGVMIPVGVLPRGAQPDPALSVYHDRCPDWVRLSDDLTRLG